MAAPDIPAVEIPVIAPVAARPHNQLLVRTISAAVLIAVCLTAVTAGPLPTGLLIGGFMMVATAEFYLITRRMGMPAAPWVLFPLAALFFARFFIGRAEAGVLTLGVSAAIVFGLAGFLLTRRTLDGMSRWGMGIAGALYLGWTLGFYMALYTQHNPDPGRVGLAWLVALVGSSIIGDTAALLVGTAIGRHRFFPSISPNKTIEGAAAGLVAQTLVFAFFALFADIPAPHNLILGALVAVAAQAGDLIESQFKRAAGLKDASNLIPGHGGVLDRMDSLVLLPTVAYYYMTLVLHVRLPQ